MTDSLHAYAAGHTVAEPDDPTFHAVDEHRRAALLRAVEAAAPDWTEPQRTTAAAALDVLWHLPSYERLVSAWRLDDARATGTIAWLIGLVQAAIDADQPPPG